MYKNLSDAEKLYANDKVSARRIKEENEKKQLEGSKLGGDIKNGNVPCVHLDGRHKSHTSPTHTREQRAKQSGVSTGTVARYDTVGGSAKKIGKRIKVLERLYEIEHGNNQHNRTSNNFKSSKTQEQLAKEMGITVQTLQNYKMLADMI